MPPTAHARAPRSLPLAALDRYRDLAGDWPAFVDALATPLPTCVWANATRAGAEPATLAAILAEEGFAATPLAWHAGAFRFDGAPRVGGAWWHRAGVAHSQEEVSLLPVRLLDARPGARALDLCAAPGGKTAHLAAALANRGTVVANDAVLGRTRALRATIERLGLMNVSSTVCDGSNFPGAAGAFDRVLVDAPCSCEGTLRKHSLAPGQTGAAVSERHARSQRALLRRAVGVCRAGGRVVYSTCTFAPEENEAVVDAVLAEADGWLRLAPAAVAGLVTRPGITAWNGRRFDSALANALRVWPHDNDTGGFFVAVIEKARDAPEPAPCTTAPRAIDAPEVDHALGERFGVSPAVLAAWTAHRRTIRGVYLVDRDHAPPPAPSPDAVGILAVRTSVRPPKPTTAASLVLAAHATRNVVDLERGQLDAFFARAALALAPAQCAECDGAGYVVARYRGFGLGVGVLDRARRMRSLFPKRWP